MSAAFAVHPVFPFKIVPPEVIREGLLQYIAAARWESARPARASDLSYDSRQAFFGAGNNRIAHAARVLYANRGRVTAETVPGFTRKEYNADCKRWRSLGAAWERGSRTRGAKAAWSQAHFFSLELPNGIWSVGKTLYERSLEKEDSQSLASHSDTTLPVNPTGNCLVVRRTPSPDDKMKEAVHRFEFRRSMIAELIDTPPVTRNLSRDAFVFYRDIRRLIEPMNGIRIYFITMAGTEAKSRCTRLREAGWNVIWVTSGGKEGNYPHVHLICIPPQICRKRKGVIVHEQMLEERALGKIRAALEPQSGEEGFCILTLKSRRARLKVALYVAKNRDQPLNNHSGRRQSMSQKNAPRLTPGERKLLHPRCTRAEMAAWHQAIETIRKRFRYPIHGSRRWIARRKKEIRAEARRTGPDWSVYAEEIPEALSDPTAQFSIMSTLGDGRKYAIHFAGMHCVSVADRLEVDLARFLTSTEIAEDLARLKRLPGEPAPYTTWGMPSTWPALALQFLSIHAEVAGS